MRNISKIIAAFFPKKESLGASEIFYFCRKAMKIPKTNLDLLVSFNRNTECFIFKIFGKRKEYR